MQTRLVWRSPRQAALLTKLAALSRLVVLARGESSVQRARNGETSGCRCSCIVGQDDGYIRTGLDRRPGLLPVPAAVV